VLDLKFIRENPEQVQKGLTAKGSAIDLQELLELDAERRAKLTEVERLKAARNQASDKIAKCKKEGNDSAPIIAEMRSTSQKITELDSQVGEIDEKIELISIRIPNVPLAEVPVSKGVEGNKTVRTWGVPREFGYPIKDHLDLATSLGWLSKEAGSKISGAGFPVYFGQGAK